jgi:dipeptidyl aminopeptidase/acylaminoacyl peptidase
MPIRGYHPRFGGGTVIPLAFFAATLMAPLSGIVPDDLFRQVVLSDLVLSPDGSAAVFVLEFCDRKSNSYRHTIWWQPLDGSPAREITTPDLDASSPKFSPDGKQLAFLAAHGEATQLYVAKAGRSRARRITEFEAGVGDFDWSPDGTRFVIVRTDPDRRSKLERQREPIVVTRLQIQTDGSGYSSDRRDHLWLIAADGRTAPRQLTFGPYDDAAPVWSPDGTTIAFVSNRSEQRDEDDNTDIWAIDPDGARLRKLAANPGPDDAPSWSPDGSRLAFRGLLRPVDYYVITRLMVIDKDGAQLRDLSGSLDTWISADSINHSSTTAAAFNWSPDGNQISTTFDRRGSNYVAQFDLSTGSVREFDLGRGLIGVPRLTPDGKQWVFSRESSSRPAELFVRDVVGGTERRLSRWHDAWLAERTLSEPERLSARNSAGDTIESWLYPPLNLDPSKKYPLVVYIHGGPQGFDGEYWDIGLEQQVLPAQGIALLRVNYRGSTSYGEAFCRSIYGDWHHREHEDIEVAVDQALQRGWIDPARIGLGGWSYGGIMTIWIAGHSARFKLGVPERFEVDYLSAFGQDQWQQQYRYELGSPITNKALYERLSPGSYADRIKMPLYLISNEQDKNCPLPQALQFYQRLKLLGVPTELVIYPGEPHSMQQPANLVDRLNRLVNWFGKL